MLRFFSRNREPGEPGLFGHSPGDIGVIGIALVFTFAGIYLCFANFTVPQTPKSPPAKPASEISVGIAPAHN
jgi:hypothetical protein